METFDPEKPLEQLPTKISNIYVKEAKKMLDKLENNRLEVTLCDASSKRYLGHKIRLPKTTHQIGIAKNSTAMGPITREIGPQRH